jgi:hypothetical protein
MTRIAGRFVGWLGAKAEARKKAKTIPVVVSLSPSKKLDAITANLPMTAEQADAQAVGESNLISPTYCRCGWR